MTLTKSVVFWMDEEENAAYPEMIQLRFHDHPIRYFTAPDAALDYCTSADFSPAGFGAYVIDAHMPTFGDPRFESQGQIDKSLAGVKFCEILSKDHAGVWPAIRERALIYTTLPPSPRIEFVRRFASEHGIVFVHKRDDGQIYDRLRELGWL